MFFFHKRSMPLIISISKVVNFFKGVYQAKASRKVREIFFPEEKYTPYNKKSYFYV